jgi:hypothetical protein
MISAPRSSSNCLASSPAFGGQRGSRDFARWTTVTFLPGCLERISPTARSVPGSGEQIVRAFQSQFYRVQQTMSQQCCKHINNANNGMMCGLPSSTATSPPPTTRTCSEEAMPLAVICSSRTPYSASILCIQHATSSSKTLPALRKCEVGPCAPSFGARDSPSTHCWF